MDWMSYAVLGGAAMTAAFVSSVGGSGFTATLLPVLVLFMGIHQAMPVATIALFFAAISRVGVNWRDVNWPVAGWFTLGSLPLVVLGTFLFTIAPSGVLTRLLGGLLIGMVIWRHWRPLPPMRFTAVWFLPFGAVFGFLTGLVSAVGPLMAPFFLAFGLVKGAYVGTSGVGVMLQQATKLAVFAESEFLPLPLVWLGLGLMPCIVLGTWLGRRLMRILPEKVFVWIVEGVMLTSGLNFLLRG